MSSVLKPGVASRALIWSGAILGAAIAVIGMFVPGGGLAFYLHTPTSTIGLPLAIALIASGAVLGRLDREPRDYGS
jgi:hypothetical protein